METRIENLEKKANLAELKIKELQMDSKQETDLQQGQGGQFLDSLLQLRQTMTNEKRDADHRIAQLEYALEENIKLKKELEKRDYRIEILKRALNESK